MARSKKSVIHEVDKSSLWVTSNPLLTGGMLDADFRNPWRIIQKYNTEPIMCAVDSSGFLISEKLRYLLVEVRSFFDDNPDTEV